MLAELMTGKGKRHAAEMLGRHASCDERACEVRCSDKRIKRSVNKSVSEGGGQEVILA